MQAEKEKREKETDYFWYISLKRLNTKTINIIYVGREKKSVEYHKEVLHRILIYSFFEFILFYS